MRLVVHEFLNLDGVMQGPGGIDEDRSNGFDRGGWIVPCATDEDQGAIVDSWFDHAGTFLPGRTTYEIMYGYWSQVTDPQEKVATALNTLPKLVVSSTLRDPEWTNSTVLSGDPVDAMSELKARDGGELQVHGSWRLAQSLHDAGLVDEYRLLIFPRVSAPASVCSPTADPPSGSPWSNPARWTPASPISPSIPCPTSRAGLAVVDGKEALTEA